VVEAAAAAADLEVGGLAGTLALCSKLRAGHAAAVAAVEAAKRSGVLTPALLRLRRRQRQLNPHLFKNEDVVLLDDSRAEVKDQEMIECLFCLSDESDRSTSLLPVFLINNSTIS
jgi:hypothetical protein